MEALSIVEVGKPLQFGSVPLPEPAEGQVLVDLKAAALNRRDYWMTRGKYPKLTFPCIMGSDGAGVFDGEPVVINPGLHWGENERVQSADFRVLGNPDPGTFAQRIAVLADHVYPKPPHLSWEEAAALPLAGLTGYRALMVRGEARSGERVLISGVGGGVALTTMQFALAYGMEVFVTSGSDEKIARALAMGAKGGTNYREDGWGEQIRSMSGGFDLIIDSAGGDGFVDLMKALKPGGRIVIYGGTRGKIPAVAPWAIFWMQMSIKGSTMGSQKDFKDMLDFVDLYQITPVVDRVFDLQDGQAALDYLADNQQFGKVVLKIPE